MFAHILAIFSSWALFAEHRASHLFHHDSNVAAGLPFQVLDALRGMSKDLVEMVMSLRPTRIKMLRAMILPSIFPDILTAWKVNLGNASRVVVVAELVGATGGIGYELLQQQQMFDMAGALAWTLQLVFFVLITQRIIAFIEQRAFRYRAVSERAL